MSKRSWRLMPLVLVAALAAATSGFARNHDDSVATAAARVKHVFVIVLENKNYSDTFGTSTQDPYLQKTLVPMGGLLTEYYTVPVTSVSITTFRSSAVRLLRRIR